MYFLWNIWLFIFLTSTPPPHTHIFYSFFCLNNVSLCAAVFKLNDTQRRLTAILSRSPLPFFFPSTVSSARLLCSFIIYCFFHCPYITPRGYKRPFFSPKDQLPEHDKRPSKPPKGFHFTNFNKKHWRNKGSDHWFAQSRNFKSMTHVRFEHALVSWVGGQIHHFKLFELMATWKMSGWYMCVSHFRGGGFKSGLGRWIFHVMIDCFCFCQIWPHNNKNRCGMNTLLTAWMKSSL